MTNPHIVELWSEGDATFRPRRPDWQKRAKCVGHTDLFFHESNDQLTAQAKKLCALCPVAKQCLQYAVTNNESGIWGGTTTIERERTRRAKVTG